MSETSIFMLDMTNMLFRWACQMDIGSCQILDFFGGWTRKDQYSC